MTGLKKRKPSHSDIHVNRHGRELPEDILADSGDALFVEVVRPFYRWKRFNFIVGLSVGLIAMYAAASTTPVAQNLNTFQDYLLLQLADIDLANILPQSDMMDEFLGNFTSMIKPTPPTEASFMPATEFK